MATDGMSVDGIKRVLDAEGVPTASGCSYWRCGTIESFILDDLYKPHTSEEIRETARRELDALSERRARLAELEGDRAQLLEIYSEKASAGLDLFTPLLQEGPDPVCRG
jgi:DNA-binding transcriptional MerR regulator